MKSALFLALLLFVLGFFPLLGGPRYEAALLAGLVGPVFATITGSLVALSRAQTLKMSSSADGLPRVLSGGSILFTAAEIGGLHALSVILVACVHGVLGDFCEPSLGFGLLLLGPVTGILLGAVLGSLVGVLCSLLLEGRSFGWKGRVFAALSAAALPLSSLILGLLTFYSTPAIYAYDPFVGYFSGPLYDTVEYDLLRLLSYRVGTFLTLCGVTAAATVLCLRIENTRTSLIASTSKRDARVGLTVALACFLGSTQMTLQGVNLGHRTTSASLVEGLGRVTTRGPCRVHFSPGVSAPEATLIAAECMGHVAQLAEYFEVPPLQQVDVFVFASAEEKRRYIGASTTYIAKPWRKEIYLQPGPFPHPVLGHELAHVVTGAFGQGPFRIAGPLGGVLPDPGRIEGFAEAASPHEHSDATLHEWAAAMKQLDLLPPVARLFQLSFLGDSAAKAYGAAGSFVDFIRAKNGPGALTSWYGGASLTEATGADLGALENEWHTFLDTVEVTPTVLALSEPRFKRPGVFERRCPHAVDRLLAEAGRYCGIQQRRSERALAEAIALDPARTDAEVQAPRCAWYTGAQDSALTTAVTQAQAEERYSPEARRVAWDLAGDIQWAKGQAKEAGEAYAAALKLTQRRDAQRELEVKLWALGKPPEVSAPLRLLLAGTPRDERDGGIELALWAGRGPERDMANYLLMRQALSKHHLLSSREFESAMNPANLPLLSVKVEAARTSLLLACRLALRGGGAEELTKRVDAYRAHSLSKAQLLEVERLVPRCLSAAQKKEGT